MTEILLRYKGISSPYVGAMAREESFLAGEDGQGVDGRASNETTMRCIKFWYPAQYFLNNFRLSVQLS